MNFWREMKKSGRPILSLAPMADVTDAAFRYIISKYSKQPNMSRSVLDTQNGLYLQQNEVSRTLLDTQTKETKGTFKMLRSQNVPFGISGNFVTYTEFVSADGLVLAPKEGRKKLLKNLEFSEIERPIVAQFFTSKPEMMEKAATLAVELGFDGVDINMGCPDRSVEKQGAGAALMKNPKLAREIIAAAKRGVQKYNDDHCTSKKCGVVRNNIPVSVKTRLGYNKDELETWLPEILAENPAAVVIHARTRKEMSKAPAHWKRIKRAVEIRDTMSRTLLDIQKILIIGNGDVKDMADAYQKCAETGADGAMIGRGIFGNPWFFSSYIPTSKERLKVLLEHTKLFEEKFSPNAKEKSDRFKSFAVMKKYFKSYLTSFKNAKEIREALMKTENAEDVEKIINNFLDLV